MEVHQIRCVLVMESTFYHLRAEVICSPVQDVVLGESFMELGIRYDPGMFAEIPHFPFRERHCWVLPWILPEILECGGTPLPYPI